MTEQVKNAIPSPSTGQALEIKEGFQWVRLPMPYRLDHVNVWAIDDGDGWSLIDTGLATEETKGLWDSLFATPYFARPLNRVFVTHMHEDHLGLAGNLVRERNAELHISATEFLMGRFWATESESSPPESAIRFYRAAGWSERAINDYSNDYGRYRTKVSAIPDSFHRLIDGQKLTIGNHEWEVIAGYGHSPEQSCFYCADLSVFVSGDQVLPRISSNVSVNHVEPAANPMESWFKSMNGILNRVPDDVLVAPSHHDVFTGLHARVRQLLGEQSAALDRLRSLLTKPCQVSDTFPVLFRSRITEENNMQLRLATGEAIANLNFLMNRGEVKRNVRGTVGWYQLT